MSSVKAPTVKDASPSPSPEASPSRASSSKQPAGADQDDTESRAGDATGASPEHAAEQAEWDPSAETSLKGKRGAVVEKNAAGTSKPTAPLPPGPAPSAVPGAGGVVAQGAGGWQAIWAPANNAYYFWNASTGAVTWENPLAPKAATEASASAPAAMSPAPNAVASSSKPPPPLPKGPPPPAAAAAPYAAAYGNPAAASPYTSSSTAPSDGLPPIDPDLAHLLPKTATAGAEYQTAQFNSRTGRFTAADYAYTPDHLSEAARAKRMSGVFFDVDAWEKQREMDHATRLEEARKRKAGEPIAAAPAKKVTKADIERFKQKKMEKKARNQAWLRE